MASLRGMPEPMPGAESLLAYQLRNERRPMSAYILKRKLRNFPIASLSERIAAAS
jgi:hypothetical protein